MTATNEATDEALVGTPIDGRAQPVAGRDGTSAEHPEGVAAAAARDVARLLDRRGLRDVVALAHRVLRESTRLTPPMAPRPDDT
jgi:hypothetical protein